MELASIAAVVTMPFWAADRKGIDIALAELLRLKPGRVILVYDEKAPSKPHALGAAKEFAKLFEDAGIDFETLSVHEDETTLRWKRGVFKASEYPSVNAVFVFPGDFEKSPTPKTREGWQHMVEKATRSGLVVGDYAARRGSFKNNFENLVGHAAVEIFFPGEAAGLKNTGLRRFRTEFFILGIDVLMRVRGDGVIWTFDPTIDLTLACLRSRDLGVSVVNIDFLDDESRRDPLGQLYQMSRYVLMLALNMIRLVPRTTDTLHQIAAYDSLRDQLKKGFEALIDGIDQNRESLLAQPVCNSKIDGIRVDWKEFRGFTVLLNNPAELSHSGDLSRVWGDIRHDPRLRFYLALSRACDRLRLQDRFFRHSLCLLPPESYHCTLADGIHPSNIQQIQTEHRPDFQRFLEGLPDSLLSGIPKGLPPTLYDDAGGWRIRFRFRKLSFPDNDPLLARLEPADSESAERYQWLIRERKRMDDALVELGKDPLGTWNPHITLGYGAVPSMAAGLRQYLPEWEAAIREETEGEVIEYSSYAVTGFLDMTQYLMAGRPQ